jgi:hypothetical protein
LLIRNVEKIQLMVGRADIAVKIETGRFDSGSWRIGIREVALLCCCDVCGSYLLFEACLLVCPAIPHNLYETV